MKRLRIGRGLLGAGGALNFASMLVPWENPDNHYHKLSYGWEFFISCAKGGAWLDGFRGLAEGLGCISPSILGCALLLSALVPRGRANALASGAVHVVLLAMLVAVAGILFAYDYGVEGADRRLVLAAAGGGVFFGVLALVEIAVAVKSVRHAAGSGDAVHVLPLVLYFLAGTALAVVLHGSEVWHSQDYAVIAAGSALGLIGVWLRRSPRRVPPPRGSEDTPEIPLAP